MAIWQDSSGGLHDDMDGEAFALPSWPQGMTQLTDAQAATIQAQQEAAKQAVLAAQPNAPAFEQAIKPALGGILAANALAVAYPLFFGALQNRAWEDVETMLVDAKSKSVIIAAQYNAIKNAATQFNIPLTL